MADTEQASVGSSRLEGRDRMSRSWRGDASLTCNGRRARHRLSGLNLPKITSRGFC